MSERPRPVTADDVDSVVDVAVNALSARLDVDWRIPAGSLDWDCWETLEHLSNSLFYYGTQLVPAREWMPEGYAFDVAVRPDGFESTIFAQDEKGAAGLLRVLNNCGGVLASLVRTASPAARAYHMWGHSDREGFAAMGIVEALVHLYDVSDALRVEWAPPEDVCDRVLARLFPGAPTDTDRRATLLWATGRGELPGHARLGDDWRWYGEAR